MKIARVFVSEYPGKQVGDIHDVFSPEQHPGSLLSGIIKEVEVADDFDAEIMEATVVEGEVTFAVSSAKQAAKAARIAAEQQEAIIGAVARARAFGDRMVNVFAAENIVLGITADGKTGEVLGKMEGVIAALSTGSLYEAIARAKAIPSSQYDSKYVTAARLLSFVNKIEGYLNIPLSTSL